MPTVSINWLSRHTGKDRRTIKKRLDKLPQDAQGKFDSVAALETIYYGPSADGNGFISQSEAVRRLTIAKEREIILSMEIQRGSRIPLEDVAQSSNEIFQMFAGTLKANHNKVLTQETINEIFDALRNWFEEWKAKADAASPCHPTLWQS
jgi:hypothetical protein